MNTELGDFIITMAMIAVTGLFLCLMCSDAIIEIIRELRKK